MPAGGHLAEAVDAARVGGGDTAAAIERHAGAGQEGFLGAGALHGALDGAGGLGGERGGSQGREQQRRAEVAAHGAS